VALLYTESMFADLSLTEIVLVVGCMLVSLSFHEAMHAFVAHSLGDTTAQEQGRLTLNPLKHVDVLTTIVLPAVLMLIHLPPFFIAKPVPFDPHQVRHNEYGAALVALAGPATNLLLAVVGSLLLRFGGGVANAGFAHAIAVFMEVNILFFVFNMIPFPPLDGSRLLYAFAPEPLQRLMLQIESAGFMMIVVFILLVFPFISPLVQNIETGIFNFLVR
jgi:Zn-dependent protease